jgi:hypothetical protein
MVVLEECWKQWSWYSEVDMWSWYVGKSVFQIDTEIGKSREPTNYCRNSDFLLQQKHTWFCFLLSPLFKLRNVHFGHVYFFYTMTGGILHSKGLEKGNLVTCNPSSLMDRRDYTILIRYVLYIYIYTMWVWGGVGINVRDI